MKGRTGRVKGGLKLYHWQGKGKKSPGQRGDRQVLPSGRAQPKACWGVMWSRKISQLLLDDPLDVFE